MKIAAEAEATGVEAAVEVGAEGIVEAEEEGGEVTKGAETATDGPTRYQNSMLSASQARRGSEVENGDDRRCAVVSMIMA